MSDIKNKALLIGIGNCGRRDDGLGWAFLDEISKCLGDKYDYDYKYQLNIEDAELISEVDTVVFIDAFSGELENGFAIEECEPVDSFEFTTHALSPGVVVSLCKSLYNAEPNAYVIKINGEGWELCEGLTKNAQDNLKKALDCFFENPDLFGYANKKAVC
ncbi:MAG: hydrogenase maturation protease [Bacteroidota bacterium]